VQNQCLLRKERKVFIYAVYIVPVTGTLSVLLKYRQSEIFTVHVILREKFPRKVQPQGWRPAIAKGRYSQGLGLALGLGLGLVGLGLGLRLGLGLGPWL